DRRLRGAVALVSPRPVLRARLGHPGRTRFALHVRETPYHRREHYPELDYDDRTMRPAGRARLPHDAARPPAGAACLLGHRARRRLRRRIALAGGAHDAWQPWPRIVGPGGEV